MLERPLRWLALVLSLIIAVSFVLFAVEDFDRASASSQSRTRGVAAIDPTPAGERARERRHGDLREAIDDANDVVLKPFAPISNDADSRWVQRGVPALLGLLVYGFALSYAARFAKGRA